MSAPELLQSMAERGFVVSLDGEYLSVWPSSRLTPKLRDALRHHKGELLELLSHGNPFADRDCTRPKEHWRDRPPAYWDRVGQSVSPGAASICATIQSFPFIFDWLHRDEIPLMPCPATINGHPLTIDSPVDTLRSIEADWTSLGTLCNQEGRDLTPDESKALDRARQTLEELTVRYLEYGWVEDLEAVANKTIRVAQIRAKRHSKTPQ